MDLRKNPKHVRLYKSARWTRLRELQLTAQPLCVACLARGEYVIAGVVDHIRPHRGDAALFYDPDNLQSLCKAHHDAKTASEDGGFGNPAPSRGV